MGEKDEKLKSLLSDKVFYADLWNGSVFHGKQFMKVEELEEISPVVTLVLYWGKKEWDGPKTLHEMINFGVGDCPEDAEFTEILKDLVPEMPLHFVDVSKIEHTEYFKTSLGPLLELYRRRNDKTSFVGYLTADEIANRMDEKSWQALIDLTGSKRLKKLIDTSKTYDEDGKKGERTMCKALEDYYNDARSEGKLESLRNLMKNLQLTAEQAMEALEIPAEEREMYLKKIV